MEIIKFWDQQSIIDEFNDLCQQVNRICHKEGGGNQIIGKDWIKADEPTLKKLGKLCLDFELYATSDLVFLTLHEFANDPPTFTKFSHRLQDIKFLFITGANKHRFLRLTDEESRHFEGDRNTESA